MIFGYVALRPLPSEPMVLTVTGVHMLKVRIQDDLVHVGPRLTIAFHRTLRIPDDERTYPLPPGLGHLPINRVSDYADRVPSDWAQEGSVFIPMYQREAMWIGFTGASWKPNAVKVEAGRINAVTGEVDGGRTLKQSQNYLVCPPQVWLDGIKTGENVIRQFVAMRLGEGYSLEAALTGEERSGGLRITVLEPKSGRFPDTPPSEPPGVAGPMRFAQPSGTAEMGLGAGGTMRQKIYPDPYGVEAWDTDNYAELRIRIVDTETFRAITGGDPPPTPIDARTYTEHGFPWFDLYDESQGDVAASAALADARTIAERDAELGRGAGETLIDIENEQVKRLGLERKRRE